MKNNLTVKELKGYLDSLADDMPVIIPCTNNNDCDYSMGFRYVRTVGILSCPEEEQAALCLNASKEDSDISSQLARYDSNITCEKLFK